MSSLCGKGLSFSSIYTHFITLKEKAFRKHCEKRFVFLNPLIATFQLWSAASLHLGWPQNGVLGNGNVTELYGQFGQFQIFVALLISQVWLILAFTK